MSTTVWRSALVLGLLVLALGTTGCIGDDEEEGVTIPSVPVTTEEDDVSTFTTPTTATTPTAPETQPDPGQADTPENDVPPPSGSPQDQFEQFCKQNPEACG